MNQGLCGVSQRCGMSSRKFGLTAVKSDLVKAPRVAESPVNMECKLLQTLNFGEPPRGVMSSSERFVLVHIRDELWAGDQIDISKWKTIGRLGDSFIVE